MQLLFWERQVFYNINTESGYIAEQCIILFLVQTYSRSCTMYNVNSEMHTLYHCNDTHAICSYGVLLNFYILSFLIFLKQNECCCSKQIYKLYLIFLRNTYQWYFFKIFLHGEIWECIYCRGCTKKTKRVKVLFKTYYMD